MKRLLYILVFTVSWHLCHPTLLCAQKKFSKLIRDVIVVEGRDNEQEVAQNSEIDMNYLSQFEGRTIGDIFILRNNVADAQSRLWVDRTINSIHTVTVERAIRRDLLFKSGQKLDPELIINNRQLIRSRNNISDVNIIAVPSAADSMIVNVYVLTRDKWTISADVGTKGNGEAFVKVYDDNVAGWGNTLSVSTYFDWKHGWKYGGNLFEYYIPNIWGSFFSARAIAGKGFDRSDYGLEFKKEFIVPTDYAGGVSALSKQEELRMYPPDTLIVTAYKNLDMWAGKSIFLTGIESSIFFTGRLNERKYTDRPEVSKTLNPYFHNERLLLGSVGLYREKFQTASLIYGYGVTEYIAYGYRVGLTGGYSWSEFGDRGYLGGEFSAGYFTPIGYFAVDASLGSYMNSSNGQFYRTSLVTNVRYFSNLLGSGRYRVRQFLRLNGTRGWNRLDGFRETTTFGRGADLRGFNDHVYGRNRLLVNTETVLFTPWNLVNFRFAPFGFADLGLIGDNSNMLNNNFYATIGVGVRVKNENLIFGTINIRLGVALNKNGFIDAEYFSISNRDQLTPVRFIPSQPSIVDYR